MVGQQNREIQKANEMNYEDLKVELEENLTVAHERKSYRSWTAKLKKGIEVKAKKLVKPGAKGLLLIPVRSAYSAPHELH